MGAAELKNEFHNLIDSITDTALLEKFYSIMQSASETAAGDLWSALPEDERLEIIRADEESTNPDNLISHEEMKKRHSKWL